MQNDVADRQRYIDYLTITEMSGLYNVSLRTLRFYEQSGLLTPIRQGMNRFYAPKDRLRLQIILTGKKLGFTLREIDDMLRAYNSEGSTDPEHMTALLDIDKVRIQISILEDQRAEIDGAIKELEAAIE